MLCFKYKKGEGAKTRNYTDVKIANLQTEWNNRIANGILSRLWNNRKIVPTEMNICETTEYSVVGKKQTHFIWIYRLFKTNLVWNALTLSIDILSFIFKSIFIITIQFGFFTFFHIQLFHWRKPWNFRIGYFSSVFVYFLVFVSVIPQACQFAYFTRYLKKMI